MSTQHTQKPTMTEREPERVGGYFPKLFSTLWHSGERQEAKKKSCRGMAVMWSVRATSRQFRGIWKRRDERELKTGGSLRAKDK